MTRDRWTVLGVAGARAEWFGEVARWSTAGSAAIEFVPCLSAAEVRARLTAGRPFSALLAGASTPGLDRDLIGAATEAGIATFVVGATTAHRWEALGVAELLAEPLDPANVVAALRRHATPLARLEPTIETPRAAPTGWRGRLVAVTGPPGAGASLTAMATAQHLAADASHRGLVLLADLALDADQAMLHDTGDVGPGVQELVEAHRSTAAGLDTVRDLTVEPVGRPYRLLLGLRRHRDWTAVRPHAFEAGLHSLLRTHRVVVADVDADTEGELETGSIDVEERNGMARIVLSRADVVVTVGVCSPGGVHCLARTIRRIAHAGDGRRHIAVLNRAPRKRRQRARATAALATLLGPTLAPIIGNPVFVTTSGDVDRSILDGVPLPDGPWRSVQREVVDRLSHAPARHSDAGPDPVPVAPGRSGTWTREAG